MSATVSHAVYVCTDCYFAHHYGASEHDGAWYAGESDTPCDREPLGLIASAELADWTCSDHAADDDIPCPYCGSTDDESGIREFVAWSACDGCGSPLGGARYRLAVWEVTS